MYILKALYKEYALFISIIIFILFSIYEHILVESIFGNLIGFSILFAVIIYSSLAVAHHAELLAEKFGEPYGTLILTISAVSVEVMIITIMILHSHNPLLARDTIYSAIMLDINGLLGISAIIGGLKFGEQPYNIDSSNSYLSMLLVAIGLAMVLPQFIGIEKQEIFMWFIVVIFIALYLVFTKIQ
ncbi:MAG: calcium:proton antiporter, partial [Sulfurovaceae bacterium]|nr:calcium:proton antiporter [Sulfurovaceae bacterium]